MKQGPYVSFSIIIIILFFLWIFWGGKKYEFVGLGPLDPETCGSYTGSIYEWGNITPAEKDIKQHDLYESLDNSELSFLSPINNRSQITKATDIVSQQSYELKRDNNSVISDAELFLTHSGDKKDNIKDYENICSESLKGEAQLLESEFILEDEILEETVCPRKMGRFMSKGERLCCETMKKIYGVEFISIWPDWLKNPETGRKLELDCYNDEIKIAVEYNGEQHYKWPNFTNQTYEQFINQVRRDDLKFRLCDKNGVYLIVVPYTVTLSDIPSYIISHLPETLQEAKRFAE